MSSTSIRPFALVQFILAELDLDDFPEINSSVQVQGGGYTGLPSSFFQDAVVHSTFTHNQDSEQGIFAIIKWDQLQNDSERALCLGRGLFQKSILEQETKEEPSWGSRWLHSSHRGKDSDRSAFLFIQSPEVSEEMVKNMGSVYQKARKDECNSAQELVWERFSSSRSAWKPIDFAVEFERRSAQDDTEEVRTSRGDVFFIADQQTVKDGSLLAVFMLTQEPVTSDPIRLLRYTVQGAALMGLSLLTVGFDNATEDCWPEEPEKVVHLRGKFEEEAEENAMDPEVP